MHWTKTLVNHIRDVTIPSIVPYKDPEKQRRYWMSWYYRSKKNSDDIKSRVQRRREHMRAWYAELKSSLRCELCGENHPSAIEFHHIDCKREGISTMLWQGYGKLAILEEISKCRVLCANCHRIQHLGDFAQREQASSVNKTKRWYFQHKQEFVCSHCGLEDSRCIELHHEDPNTKDAHIAELVSRNKLSAVKKELEKCTPLCANCHRKLHSEGL